jgi:hypothetical protein
MTTNSILQAIPEDGGQVADAQRPDRFVTSNGIVFKLKSVAPLLIMDAQRNFTEPQPPKIRNFEKGDGDDAPLEDNPNDPKYQRELNEYRRQLGEIANAIYLIRGTEIVSIPDDIDKPDDEDWTMEVQDFAGITVPKVGRRRYFCWIKYVALESMADFQGLMNKLTTLGGVTVERDVIDAEQSFRADESGDTAEGIPPSEEV